MSVRVCRWHPGGMWVCECVGVQVYLHMHVLLCIRRVVIAPVRTNSNCEELVSMEGSVPPTAHVWSHSGLAKYTAARSLISAADISKQHKNVGAVPSPHSLSPFMQQAWPGQQVCTRSVQGASAALGPCRNTHSCVHTCTYKWLSGIHVREGVGCGFRSGSARMLPSEL